MYYAQKYARPIIIISLLSVLLMLFACSSQTIQPVIPDEPVVPPQVTAPPSDNTSALQPDIPSSKSVNRVDVVYCHRPQRCPTCLCFEERVRYVVSTYFQNDIDSGKMTFGVYNIGDSANRDIVTKYHAVGSQLFINTVQNGTDNIVDVQDIWSWSCRSNRFGFDQQVKSIIEQSLEAIE
jgi:hypothetical protein